VPLHAFAAILRPERIVRCASHRTMGPDGRPRAPFGSGVHAAVTNGTHVPPDGMAAGRPMHSNHHRAPLAAIADYPQKSGSRWTMPRGVQEGPDAGFRVRPLARPCYSQDSGPRGSGRVQLRVVPFSVITTVEVAEPS